MHVYITVCGHFSIKTKQELLLVHRVSATKHKNQAALNHGCVCVLCYFVCMRM